MTAGPYSRFYWRFIDEFPEVYDDDRAFATWVRLLVTAEGSYPAPAQLPRRVRPASLDRLVECGLVVLLPGDRYRIKGVEAERERRSEAGRSGGLASGRSRSQRTTVERPFPYPTNEIEPSKAEQSKAKTSRDETRRANGAAYAAEIDTLSFDGDAYKAEVDAKIKRRQGLDA